MPFIRGKNGQRGRQRWRANCRHCQVLDAYQAARDHWDRLRESGDPCGPGVPGAAHSAVGYYQLSDEEFRMVHPMPQFKDFLVRMAQDQHDPDEDQGETDGRYAGEDRWPAA